jgi:Lsr2
MATVTRTALIDDLDGSDADITVTLTVDGSRTRVDLSNANYAEWIAPLVKAGATSRGRPAAKKATRSAKRAPAGKKAAKTTAYARLSAKDQGAVRAYLKRPRGRIADDAVGAWKGAGKPKG